jgi:hypothetical protein
MRCDFTSPPLLPDVFLHPTKNGFMPTLAIERTENPMSFIGKDERFGRHTIPAERCEKLKALIDRYAKILFVRNDESRRLDFIAEQMR